MTPITNAELKQAIVERHRAVRKQMHKARREALKNGGTNCKYYVTLTELLFMHTVEWRILYKKNLIRARITEASRKLDFVQQKFEKIVGSL